jgi:polysaccharide export outer membrane protein
MASKFVTHSQSKRCIAAPFALAALAFAVIFSSGCATLSSFGIPVGSPANRLLKSAKTISEIPGQSLLLQKELAIVPLNEYVVEISDTVSIEPVSFDATIRLPGDQVVKPDGNVTLGEFGLYQAAGKTLEQMQLEIQAEIDSQIRAKKEVEFSKEQTRLSQLRADETFAPKLGFEVNALDDSKTDDDLDLDEETDSDTESEDVILARERRTARLNFEQELDKTLSQNRISVRLTNWDSKKIYVLGEVNSPGAFLYRGNETVLDAIIEAGGIGTKANHHAIIVSRPSSCGDCRTVMKVCYDQIVQLGDASTNYQLLPGDRVYVPSLSFMDDLKQSLNPFANDKCPRCSCDAVGCSMPQGCE